MSSTARGSQRSPADFYSSPAWCVHRLLERVKLPGGTWLESSAGTGSIIKAVNAVRKDVKWAAVELRSECRPALETLGIDGVDLVTGCSFLSVPPAKPSVVCISNVPFNLAQEFIEHTLKFAPHVIHLLRLNYLGTEKRNEFFRGNCPDVYVIPDRVSFVQSVTCSRTREFTHSRMPLCDYTEIFPLYADTPGDCPKCGALVRLSSSDSIEYAWYHWGPERGRRSGKIEVLDHTPVSERR